MKSVGNGAGVSPSEQVERAGEEERLSGHLLKCAIDREIEQASIRCEAATLYAVVNKYLEALEAAVVAFEAAGPVWDYVRSLGPTSPPPSDASMSEIDAAVMELYERSGANADKIEALHILLRHTRNSHRAEWDKMRRFYESSLRQLLSP